MHHVWVGNFGSGTGHSVRGFRRTLALCRLSACHNLKLLIGNSWRIRRATFARSGYSAVAACVLEDLYHKITGWGNELVPGKRNGRAFSHLVDGRSLQPDHDTCSWLSDGCFNHGSLVDTKQVHARLFKLGIAEETSLCERLMDIYSKYGDSGGTTVLFDGMLERNVLSWNRIISGLLLGKKLHLAFSYLPKMLLQCQDIGVPPDPNVFGLLVRACAECNAPSRYIHQLHAMIIRYSLSSYSIVGNPLIDFYSKYGSPYLAWLVFKALSSPDRISWVAMITGFSQSGHEDEALFLYQEMCRSGVNPTSYVFSSVLSACTKAGLVENGKQVHAQAFKWGLWSDTFVCNALISLYSRSGHMGFAEKVFRKMSCADLITYNSLISGHVQSGNSGSAIQIHRVMQRSSIKPDSVTTASLLSACASTGDSMLGHYLHCYVIKVGLSLDIIIEGSLLNFYVNCSDVDTACQFFHTTQKKNIVLWNVMLMAYGRQGKLEESFELFSQMLNDGIRPNQYTYPSILRTCTLKGAIEAGEQIHNRIVKSGFECTVHVSSILIDMYCKHGKLEDARYILNCLSEKDVVCWTAMTDGYAQHGFFSEAIDTFKEMLTLGIQPDKIGLSNALSACAALQAFKQGLQVHAHSLVLGFCKDLSVGNALANLYARCGLLNDAYAALQSIEVTDEVSWNGLISGFAQSGLYEEALKVLSRMNQADLNLDLFTFVSSLSAAANMAEAKQGKQIHARMVKAGYNSETVAGNALISFYSKCGSLEDARKEFLLMPYRNEVTWNSMITGCSQHGYGRQALELFEQMKKQELKPNYVTYIGVLAACSHVGLVEEGLHYFKTMSEDVAIVPRSEHYVCVVDILGRSGQLERARRFVEEMPIAPDAMVWKTLLSACRVHKNIEIGEFAAQHLLQLEPQDSATYVLLSNMYALERKWDCRDHTRRIMKERGVKKEPGRSWIEVKNSIHAFYVGDRLHPMVDQIYAFLDDLNKRVTIIGYVPDKTSILHDIEQDPREPVMYIHSEKIAVAFGLMSLSKEIPILVMKNLRVCNDCHNWMKYVCTIVGRPIILRDAYRFHHFKDGGCSCGDYW